MCIHKNMDLNTFIVNNNITINFSEEIEGKIDVLYVIRKDDNSYFLLESVKGREVLTAKQGLAWLARNK